MIVYILLIVVFMIYHQYKFISSYPTMIKPNVEDETIEVLNKKINSLNSKINEIKNETKIIKNETKARDIKVIHKIDHPPERRLPRHQLHPLMLKRRINIPTRGYPDNYTLQGILVRNSDEKTLQLYGRQKYPGSNQWEYYAVGNDSNAFNSKLPVKVKGDREIYDNDIIELPFLDQKKGDFKAKLYDLDQPRYIPHI